MMKPAIAAMHGPHSLVRCGNQASDAIIRPVSVRSCKCTTKMVTQYDSVVLTKATGAIRDLSINGDQSNVV